jgi:hypothetical protein
MMSGRVCMTAAYMLPNRLANKRLVALSYVAGTSSWRDGIGFPLSAHGGTRA